MKKLPEAVTKSPGELEGVVLGAHIGLGKVPVHCLFLSPDSAELENLIIHRTLSRALRMVMP